MRNEIRMMIFVECNIIYNFSSMFKKKKYFKRILIIFIIHFVEGISKLLLEIVLDFIIMKVTLILNIMLKKI